MAKKNKNNKPAHELDQQSIDFLSLSKQPFTNEILTDQSFFNNQALTKIIDSLSHQVQFSDLLLLVEGIHGSGKTSLFRQFIQTEIANTKLLSIQAEATDTLVQIQQKMSLHLQDLGDANHLSDNLKNLQMFDQTPLIVIDNSHVLSDTTLQELFRYQQQIKQEHDVNLKILLFANSGMQDTLQKITDIQADQMYVQNIPELSPKQLENFITHKLKVAGYSGESILDSKDIQNLYKKCNGTPLNIMNEAAPLIDKIVDNKIHPASAGRIKILIAFIILLSICAVAYLSYTYSVNENKEVIPPVAPGLSTEPENNDTLESTSKIEAPVESTIESTSSTESVTTDITEIPANNEQTLETVTIEDRSDVTAAIESSDTKTTNIKETATEAVNEPTPIIAEEKAPDIKPEPEPEKNLAIEKVETVTKTVDPINPALRQLSNIGIHDADWLKQQNSQNWALQLLGARDPETLLNFSQHNNLSINTAWYKTWLAAKPYYVLVYGNYTSRDAARNAIADLPPKLRALKPWAKSMKSIQKALN